MKTFQVYKTNIGLFINNSGYNSYSMDRVKINGKISIPIENGYMFVSEQTIYSYETLQSASSSVSGYDLVNKDLHSDAIPLELSVEQVDNKYNSYTEEFEWQFPWTSIKSLYKEIYKTEPELWKSEEFEVTVLREFEIDSYNKPTEMKIGMISENRYSFDQKLITSDLSSIVIYSDIEKLLTPEFMLHERPCSLSSSQVYSIVRNHINENIDGHCARVTSDYNFCFAVKRLVSIKPYVYKTETKKANGRSYATPRIKSKTVSNIEVDVFEMTHSGDPYKGYTVIGGWNADNLLDMKNQIEFYLSELMLNINANVEQCNYCNGTGHVHSEKLLTNNRQT